MSANEDDVVCQCCAQLVAEVGSHGCKGLRLARATGVLGFTLALTLSACSASHEAPTSCFELERESCIAEAGCHWGPRPGCSPLTDERTCMPRMERCYADEPGLVECYLRCGPEPGLYYFCIDPRQECGPGVLPDAGSGD